MIPRGFNSEEAEKALSGENRSLSAAFRWMSTDQGHNFWSEQCKSGLHGVGKVALYSMINEYKKEQGNGRLLNTPRQTFESPYSMPLTGRTRTNANNTLSPIQASVQGYRISNSDLFDSLGVTQVRH